MAVTFDTLKAATRLREQADFSEKQATVLVETLADGIVDRLATREDLKNTEQALRGDLEKTEQELRDDLEKTEQGLRGDLGALRGDLEKTKQGLRADLDRNTASLRNEMHKLEHRMTLRLGTVIAAGVAIIVCLRQAPLTLRPPCRLGTRSAPR